MRRRSKIEALTLPPCPYLVVYRDQSGEVTSQRALRPPLWSADEAIEQARRLAAAGDVFCDVFEVIETRRVGGWHFRSGI